MSKFDEDFSEMMRLVRESFKGFNARLTETLLLFNQLATFKDGFEMTTKLPRFVISHRDRDGDVFFSNEVTAVVEWLEAERPFKWNVLDRKGGKQWPGENFVHVANTCGEVFDDSPALWNLEESKEFRYSICERGVRGNPLGEIYDTDEAHEVVTYLKNADNVYHLVVLDRDRQRIIAGEEFILKKTPLYNDRIINSETLATVVEDVPERIVAFLQKNTSLHYKVSVLIGETLQIVEPRKYLEGTK